MCVLALISTCPSMSFPTASFVYKVCMISKYWVTAHTTIRGHSLHLAILQAEVAVAKTSLLHELMGRVSDTNAYKVACKA